MDSGLEKGCPHPENQEAWIVCFYGMFKEKVTA